jgi:Zn-dependent alcohol dehydrogenase
MKCVILEKSKKPLVYADVEIPSKLTFGQVLIKIKYSGICGSQINEIDSIKGQDKYLPHLLGHEGSGIVEKIGEGVTKVKPGDHVVLHWRKGSGLEALSPNYIWKNKKLNSGKITTFSEKSIVSENRITKIPHNFDLKLAALFGCAILTAYGVVNNDAKVKIGQSVLVFGLGGIGLSIIQAAKLVTAFPIIGVDINKNKINLAKKFGLTSGILYKKVNISKELSKFLDNGKADVVIETSGKKEIIERAYNATKPNGKTILVGVPKKKINIYTLPLHFEKILTGSHGGSANPDEDIPNYVQLVENNIINFKNLITHEFKLQDINKAIRLIRKGNCGRVIINMNSI